MPLTPLLSVRVIAYQNIEYIKQCIDSVLMQKTNFPFEICIGEDGSTDGTREVCLEYQSKHPDIVRVFLWDRNLPEHKTMPPARYNFINTIKNCVGKYIALLDGDDYWIDPLKLQNQVDFLEAHSDYSICFHNAKVIGDKKAEGVKLWSDLKWSKLDVQKDEYSVEDLLKSPLIPTASALFRNDFGRKFPSWFSNVMSGDMALYPLILNERKVKYLNETMSVYRQHSAGISQTHIDDTISLNRIYMYRKLSNHLDNKYKDTIGLVIRENRKHIKGNWNRMKSFIPYFVN